MSENDWRANFYLNFWYFLLHAVAAFVFFIAAMGFVFQDSPKFALAPWYWETLGEILCGASALGIPSLAIASVVFTIKGRVKPARIMCWASLALPLALLASVIGLHRSIR